MMLIFGNIEDQITHLIWPQVSKLSFLFEHEIYQYIFRDYLFPFKGNQPLFFYFMTNALKYGGQNAYNILLFVFLALAIIVTFLYFKKERYSFVYVLIFVFSTYTYIHFSTHPILSQIWLIPLFFIFFEKIKKYPQRFRNYLLVSLVLFFTTLISNYFGFFLSITYFLLVAVRYKKFNLKYFFLSLLTLSVVLVLSLLPFIKESYFGVEEEVNTHVSRSYDDFITFSSRPWYFFIPPVKNPFYSGLANSLIGAIKNTGYYLADDYFPFEHQANFFGYLLTFSLVCLTYLSYKRAEKEDRREILASVFVIFIIFLFMLPPTFTVLGIRIYSPGFLVSKFFPMFRTTARFSIVILFLLLILLSDNIKILSNIPDKYKRFFKIFLPILLVVTFFETYIPVKVRRFEIPKAFEYMRENTLKSSTFVVYPYGKVREAELWIPVHQRVLLNHRGYVTKDFNSEVFTETLTLQNALGDYVVVFKQESYEALLKDGEPAFDILKEFEDSYLLHIR